MAIHHKVERLGTRLWHESLPYQQLIQNSVQLNIFHFAKNKFHHNVFELIITKENFESFSTQVKRMLEALPELLFR